jgi:hypothetical protein
VSIASGYLLSIMRQQRASAIVTGLLYDGKRALKLSSSRPEVSIAALYMCLHTAGHQPRFSWQRDKRTGNDEVLAGWSAASGAHGKWGDYQACNSSG